MNRQFERYLQMTLVALDLAVLNVAYFLCYFIFSNSILPQHSNSYFKFWVALNVLWLLLAFFLRNYGTRVILNFEYFIKRTMQVYLLWIILIMSYLFLTRNIHFSRLFIISVIGGFGVALMINRFLYLGIKNYFKRSQHLIKKVIILGYNDTAKKLAKYFEEDGINTELIGFIEDNKNIRELSHYPVLSNINGTLQIAKDMDVQEIYSTITPEQNKDIYNLMYQAEKECIRFKVVPNLSLFITREVHIEYFGDLPILSLRSEPLDDVGNRLKKRALDIVVSFFVIVLILSWMIPLLALLIFLESGESVFFKQLKTKKS